MPSRASERRRLSTTSRSGSASVTVIRDVTFTVAGRPGQGRVHRHSRAVGLRQVDRPAADRRTAAAASRDAREPCWSAGKPVDGPGLGPRHGVPGLHLVRQSHGASTTSPSGSSAAACRQRERRELAREWIAKVGLDVKRDAGKYPDQLSGGMRQRVAIARTLILSPRIILMDEPFGALDPATRLNMQDLLVELWREAQATVFFVTHSIEEAVYLGDRVYIFSPRAGHDPPARWTCRRRPCRRRRCSASRRSSDRLCRDPRHHGKLDRPSTTKLTMRRRPSNPARRRARGAT